MLALRSVAIGIIALCLLIAANAAADDFLPKEVQQCVEEFVKPPVESKDCPPFSNPKTIGLFDVPNSSKKVQVETDSDSESIRLTLLNHPDNARDEKNTTGEKIIVIPVKGTFQYGDPRVYLKRVGKVPVILLDDTVGGNCANCGTFIVVSLEAESMLHVLGTAVPGNMWEDKWDDIEQVELVYYYDVLEVTPWLGDYLSPYMTIHLKISNGKLTPDKEKCIAEWKQTLLQDEERLNKNLEQEPESSRTAYMFSFILTKLLCDHLNEKGEEAWKDFRSNLKPLLDKNGKLVTGRNVKETGYTPTEIEAYLRKAMSRQCQVNNG